MSYAPTVWRPSTSTYSVLPSALTASSSGCAPAPSGSVETSVMLPSRAMAKVEIEAPRAFAVNAKRPFGVTASQHGAAWPVATGPVIRWAPALSTVYDDAEPAASDTNARPWLSNAKPNGVAPADAVETPGCARPSRTAYTSSVLVVFSVTMSCLPSLENATCAGPLPSRGCVEPAIGFTLPLPSIENPVICDEPAFSA